MEAHSFSPKNRSRSWRWGGWFARHNICQIGLRHTSYECLCFRPLEEIMTQKYPPPLELLEENMSIWFLNPLVFIHPITLDSTFHLCRFGTQYVSFCLCTLFWSLDIILSYSELLCQLHPLSH